MCLFNIPDKVKQVLDLYGPDEWMYGYKIYELYNRNNLLSPFIGKKININKQRVVSDSSVSGAIMRRIVVSRGIHIYKTEECAKPMMNRMSGLTAKTPVLVKVYGQVKDLIGVGEKDAVFKSVIIDQQSLDGVRKFMKGVFEYDY